MNENTTAKNESLFGEVIYSYTRAQALEDGVLIDVSETAREAGFRFHTALTDTVWGIINSIPERLKGFQDVKGRLWDVLFMASLAGKKAKTNQVLFGVILDQAGTLKRETLLKIHIGPGDNAEPVITIMLPTED